MENKDYKHVMQDFSSFYIGARFTYQEMMEHEDMPFKWKAVIMHYIIKEVDPGTKMEDHLFYMTQHDFSYQTYVQLKAKFKLLVWEDADPKRHKKSGYVSREYKIEEIVASKELHDKMNTIIVQELHLGKMALMSFAV